MHTCTNTGYSDCCYTSLCYCCPLNTCIILYASSSQLTIWHFIVLLMQVVSVYYSSHYHDNANRGFHEDYGRYFKLTFAEDMNNEEAKVSADVSVSTFCDILLFPRTEIWKLRLIFGSFLTYLCNVCMLASLLRLSSSCSKLYAQTSHKLSASVACLGFSWLAL